MKLTDLFRAMRFLQLLYTIDVGLRRLKSGKKGDSVAFSGVVIHFEGKRYEIKGVIVRLDD